jgi:uncharacterized protein (TIGR00299 family) protein
VKTLFINPISGIAGDMFVGALLDAGADTADFWQQLNAIAMPCESWEAGSEPVMRRGIAATHFTVTVNGDAVTSHNDTHGGHGHSHHHGRHLGEIIEIISAAAIAESAKTRACRVFELLAAAEGKIHKKSPDAVHFHEVGAVDAIADIVGACLALDVLGVDSVVSTAVAVGGGTVNCSHGVMPVPAPAVAELLTDVPVLFGTADFELTTPTGAALLTALTADFSGRSRGTIVSSGYGAGTRDLEHHANVLQVVLTEFAGKAADTVDLIECNIDDMPGEWFSHITPTLLDAGALDVTIVPCTMKKGRPGTVLQVMAANADRQALVDILFAETTTFGVRWHTAERQVLSRKNIEVDTTYGVISVKLGFAQEGGALMRIAPEYESCRAAAAANSCPLSAVYEAATAAARNAD